MSCVRTVLLAVLHILRNHNRVVNPLKIVRTQRRLVFLGLDECRSAPDRLRLQGCVRFSRRGVFAACHSVVEVFVVASLAAKNCALA